MPENKPIDLWTLNSVNSWTSNNKSCRTRAKKETIGDRRKDKTVSIKTTISELTGEAAFFEVEPLTTERGEMRGYKHAPKTLTEIIQNARGHGDQGFIVAGDTRLTFAQFFERADTLRA